MRRTLIRGQYGGLGLRWMGFRRPCCERALTPFGKSSAGLLRDTMRLTVRPGSGEILHTFWVRECRCEHCAHTLYLWPELKIHEAYDHSPKTLGRGCRFLRPNILCRETQAGRHPATWDRGCCSRPAPSPAGLARRLESANLSHLSQISRPPHTRPAAQSLRAAGRPLSPIGGEHYHLFRWTRERPMHSAPKGRPSTAQGGGLGLEVSPVAGYKP
jgi:hypothetical protein